MLFRNPQCGLRKATVLPEFHYFIFSEGIMSNFILSCESTVDLPYSYLVERNIPVIFYKYTVDGVQYTDDLGKDPDSLPNYYKLLAGGAIPATSQINTYEYEQFFEEQLQKGDLIHVTLSSGITGSYANAVTAAENLKEKYPDRKICVIDSYGASSGFGMLIDTAADLRDDDMTFEYTRDWILNNRLNIHHQFYSITMDYFKRSGRVSGPAAAIATILNICPMMRFDSKGKIIAYEKVRGIKNVIRKTAEAMLDHANNGHNYSGKCFISHSNCPDAAKELKSMIIQSFRKLNSDDIRIFDIGTIIASHTGPGTLALFFFGDERK